ncbi:MAG: aldehyde dehydrogenase, partial [Alcanivorax sp.]|nr:aldehyde dehydrogenase [Alcanivorax sp.]
MIYHNPGSEGAVVAFNERYENYIGGQWVAAESGETFDVYNPSNDQVIARAQSASK